MRRRCSAISDFDRRVAFVNAELEKIRAIPGVVNAGAISRIPLTVNRPGDVLSARRPVRGRTCPDRSRSRAWSPAITSPPSARACAKAASSTSPTGGRIRRWRSSTRPLPNRNFPGRSPLGARFKFGRTERKGLLVHDRRRREGDSRARRGGRIEARDLSPARTGRPDRRPAERHRGSHGGRAGVDRLGGPAGDLVRR